MTQPAVVIFAAGRGTRLRPLTEHLPKPLVPILDVPLIDLALERCKGAGGEIFVNLSHLGNQLKRHLDGAGVSILDEGNEPFGTGGTLRALMPRLPEEVVTYNSDVFTDISIPKLVAAHRASAAEATLAVAAVDTDADLVLGDRPRFVDRRTESLPGFRFIGVACFNRGFLDNALSHERPLGLGETAIRRAVDEGRASFYEHPGVAFDVGTFDDLLAASTVALERPDLVTGPGDRSRGVYLGPSTSASEGSLGEGAVLLRGSSTEPGARVTRSIVWMNEVVPAGVELSDTIWFDNARLV